MNTLGLRNVCKSFGEVEVLQNINLEVEEGAFVIFVGPSGRGRSTLLRVIAGLKDDTSGDVEITGDRMKEKPPAKRCISTVLQSYALYPQLTVRSKMSRGPKRAKRSKDYINERVDLAVEMLDLRP